MHLEFLLVNRIKDLIHFHSEIMKDQENSYSSMILTFQMREAITDTNNIDKTNKMLNKDK